MAFLLCVLTMPVTMGLQPMNRTSGITEMQIVTYFKNEAQAFFSDVSCSKKVIYTALGFEIAL